MEDLNVYQDDKLLAVVTFTPAGKVTMRYTEPSAAPISMSLPNDGSELDHRTVRHFFDNLLPDNDNVRKRWAEQFTSGHRKVSWRNPFTLLSHMGQDVAGALRIAPVSVDLDTEAGFTPVSEETVGARLETLASGSAAWAQASPEHLAGRFSLAGAQAKIALTTFDGGNTWYEPTGDFPSTHIIKPSIPDLDDQDLVEHLSVQAGIGVGLPMSNSTYRGFGGHSAIMSTRYDREVAGYEVRRLHQEDLCQALGVPPSLKYQSDGGPSAARVVGLLRDWVGEEAVDTFIRSLAYSWAIEHTDGHAKNYSLLYPESGKVELAPLYDICSAIPFRHSPDSRDPRTGHTFKAHQLAFKIGNTYVVDGISQNSWVALAQACDIDTDRMLGIVRDVLNRTPEAMETAVRVAGADPKRTPALGRLMDTLPRHVESLSARIPESTPAVPPPTALKIAQTSGGEDGPDQVWVQPHLRGGRQVHGHWRARPGDRKLS